MLHLKAPKNHLSQEFLIVYDRHSSIERWWNVAQSYSRYGAITMPDLPGFGGMDSFYSINKTPDLDSMADYLASFVKWRYKRKKVKFIGIGYGFLVATRMLQRYPDLAKKVELIISIGGYTHYEDLAFTKQTLRRYRYSVRFLSTRPIAFLFRHIALNPYVLRQIYDQQSSNTDGVKDTSNKHMQWVEKQLIFWRCNDVRTRWVTAYDMLTVDNCRKQIPIAVWRVPTDTDRYVSMHHVEQHLHVVFNDFHEAQSPAVSKRPKRAHAEPDEAIAVIPTNLKRVLASSKKS